MTENDNATNTRPSFITGVPRGEHHASCLQSYFDFGLPENDKWFQFDLTTPDDKAAHDTFTSILGIPQPSFDIYEPEHIAPAHLHIPIGTFLTRQAFGDEALCVIYRAGYGTP